MVSTDTLENFTTDNPNQILMNDESSFNNEIEGTTITGEAFESIPNESSNETVILIPLRKRKYQPSGKIYEGQKSQKAKRTKTTVFTCDICKFSCLNKKTLQVHIDDAHVKSDVAGHNDSPVGSDQTKVETKGSKKMSSKVNCNICGFPFFDKSTLKRHFKRIHLNIIPEKKKVCSECKRCFATESQLEAHRNGLHLNEKPYQCESCEKCFTTGKALNEHDERVHLKRLNHKCKYCGKKFYNSDELKNHANRVHLKIKPLKRYSCTECKKIFEKKVELENHINSTHLNVKPYKCDSCSKCFTVKKLLKRHVDRVHLKVKNHTCETCRKGFYKKKDYKRHLQTHVDVTE